MPRGRPKKIIAEKETEVKVNLPITADNFELSAEIVAGSLTSNAKELRLKIEEKLKDYSVEKYIDNPDAAKADKAFLNKIKDSVATKRKEVTSKWNDPLNTFLEEMKGLEKSIVTASDGLNAIVKEAENKEKEIKKNQILEIWNNLNCNLIPFEKIFNSKWLNKGYQIKNIQDELSEIIEKVNAELLTLKSMTDEDSEILQAFYLETLDLNATLAKGNALKANRAALKEQAEKAKNESNNTENEQKSVENCTKDANSAQKTTKNDEKEQILSFRLELFGTAEKLIALRKFIDANGISYKKI